MRSWLRAPVRDAYTRLAWLVLLLAAVSVTAVNQGGTRLHADEPSKNSDLPADLKSIPPDAVMFVSVRLADIFSSAPVQEVQKKLPKDFADALKTIEKEIGSAPADIERLSMVVLETRSQHAPLIFVATAKPYDRAKVLGALPEPKVENRKGHMLYVKLAFQEILTRAAQFRGNKE